MEKAEPLTRKTILAIRAWTDPGTIERVVNIFTVRGIVPTSLSCRQTDRHILIEVELDTENRDQDEILLERLRSLVCVDRAEYAWRSR